MAPKKTSKQNLMKTRTNERNVPNRGSSECRPCITKGQEEAEKYKRKETSERFNSNIKEA